MMDVSNKKTTDLNYQDIMDYVGDTAHLGGRKTTRIILKHLVFKNKKPRVLDAGCGTGKTIGFISKKLCCQMFGIDKNKTFLSKAKRTTDTGRLIAGDVTILPFKDEVFDAVICEDVLPFVDDVEACIKELTRVSKKEGLIALTTSVYHQEPDEETREKTNTLYGMKLNTIVLHDFMELLERYSIHDIKLIQPSINLLDGLKALHPLSWVRMFSLILISRDLRQRLLFLFTLWLKMIKTRGGNARFMIIIGRVK